MDLNKKNNKELVNKRKSGEYRKVAEAVLKRFGIKNPESMDDEKLIMEFSKMAHHNAVFSASTSYPAGDLIKCQPTSRVDGIIWATWFAPDFVKAIIPDREFQDIWNRERQHKVKNEGQMKTVISSEKIMDKILEKDSKFLISKTENEQNVNIINIVKLFEILGEVYNKELEENLGYIVPNPLEILNIFTQSWGFDSLADFIVLSEQEITENNEKLSYVKISEEETISIDDLISDFEEDSIEDEEEIEEDEENEDNDIDFDGSDLFDDE